MKNPTEEETIVYNLWLKCYAKISDRPYKKRNDFSSLDADKLLSLENLAAFIKRNNIKNVEEYFDAVFEHFEGYVDLIEFTKPSAIGVYNRAMKRKMFKDKSLEELKEIILQDFKTIGEFCIKNRVDIREYLDIFEGNGTIPRFIIDLQKQRINPVTFWIFPSFKDKFLRIPLQLREFILTEDVNSFILSCETNLNKKSIRDFLFENYNKVQDIIHRSNNRKNNHE